MTSDLGPAPARARLLLLGGVPRSQPRPVPALKALLACSGSAKRPCFLACAHCWVDAKSAVGSTADRVAAGRGQQGALHLRLTVRGWLSACGAFSVVSYSAWTGDLEVDLAAP